jgi:geranylgeranylglycerol-phosphate geranylgeranyltransferase
MKDKIKAVINITRPSNCFIGSITTTIAILTVNEILKIEVLLYLDIIPLIIFIVLSYFTYFSIAAAGNIINDIYDIEIDKINRPERPLPSGRLTIKEAWIETVILWIIGILLAFLTNIVGGIIATIFAFIGFLYAAKGKILGAFGNFMVAFSFAFGLIYGAIIIVYQLTGLLGIPLVIWFYYFTAFLLLWGREVIKGMEDIEGDVKRGVQTIAIKYGIKTAAKTAIIMNIFAIISFITSLLIGLLGVSPLPKLFYIIMFFPTLISASIATFLIARNPELKKDQKRASFLDKIGALTGLIAFLLGVF